MLAFKSGYASESAKNLPKALVSSPLASISSFGLVALTALFLALITASKVSFSCPAYPFTVSTKFGIRSALLFRTTSI